MRIARHIWLAVGLSGLWLMLSGHFDGLILGMGLGSVALVVWVSSRAGVVDDEGMPFGALPRALPYCAWLLVEIVKSNVAMLRVLVARSPAIRPQIVKVPVGVGNTVARVTYTNSITMTPGTVALRVNDERILVHALTDETAAGVRSGDMERRAMRVGGSKKEEIEA